MSDVIVEQFSFRKKKCQCGREMYKKSKVCNICHARENAEKCRKK